MNLNKYQAVFVDGESKVFEAYCIKTVEDSLIQMRTESQEDMVIATENLLYIQTL